MTLISIAVAVRLLPFFLYRGAHCACATCPAKRHGENAARPILPSSILNFDDLLHIHTSAILLIAFLILNQLCYLPIDLELFKPIE